MGKAVDIKDLFSAEKAKPLEVYAGDVIQDERDRLRRAWDEVPTLVTWFQRRHGLDRDDAAICIVHSVLSEAEQAAASVPEAGRVLEFTGRLFQ